MTTQLGNDGHSFFQMLMPWGQQRFRLFFQCSPTTFILSMALGRTATQSATLAGWLWFSCNFWHRFLLLVHWTCQHINATTGWFFRYFAAQPMQLWLSQVDCFWGSPGSFSGGHYHFCFQTNVMLPQPLQLWCLQWMHAVAAWQCGRSPPPATPKIQSSLCYTSHIFWSCHGKA